MSRSHRRSRSGCSRHSAKTERLGQVLAAPGVTVINDGTDLLRVSGITISAVSTHTRTKVRSRSTVPALQGHDRGGDRDPGLIEAAQGLLDLGERHQQGGCVPSAQPRLLPGQPIRLPVGNDRLW